VVRPDKAQSKIKVALSGIIVEVQAVGIGDKQWLTNPLTQRWEAAPPNWGYNPAVLFDAQTGIASLLQRVADLTRAGDDALDGKTHYKLTGKIAGKDVAPMTAYMVTGSDVSFTLWVGADDFILRKVHISEKDAGESEATEWDIALSAFDNPVKIEAPVVK
jgi:LppX/LprAFG-like lipoprotein